MTPEDAAAIRDHALATIANESKTTGRVIAAIPDDQKGYKPDPKSFSAVDLAWHLVTAEVSLLKSAAALDFTPSGDKLAAPDTIQGIVAWYDENLPGAIQQVKDLTSEQLLTTVEFATMNFPLINYFSFLVNHSVHHRGQLSTYLRPMGSKVPSIYGPSADEGWNAAKPEEAAGVKS